MCPRPTLHIHEVFFNRVYQYGGSQNIHFGGIIVQTGSVLECVYTCIRCKCSNDIFQWVLLYYYCAEFTNACYYYYTGYPEHEISPMADGYNTYKVSVLTVAKRNGSKKSSERRMRATFSSNQTAALEKAFQEKQYLSSEDRIQLAKGLGILENQVKVWFQNRRTKSRRSAWRKKPEDGTRTSEGESV